MQTPVRGPKAALWPGAAGLSPVVREIRSGAMAIGSAMLGFRGEPRQNREGRGEIVPVPVNDYDFGSRSSRYHKARTPGQRALRPAYAVDLLREPDAAHTFIMPVTVA